MKSDSMETSKEQGSEVATSVIIEQIYKKWRHYKSKNDIELFMALIDDFATEFSHFIDVDFSNLQEERTLELSPHACDLPDDFLQQIGHHLLQCSELGADIIEHGQLLFAQNLVKCLIVFCRNPDNIPFVSSCDHISHIVNISSVLLSKMCGGSIEDIIPMIDFTDHALHFMETMYDPFNLWRRLLRGWNKESTSTFYQPAALHVEVVPFFYECFHMQSGIISTDIQARLVHVFGAVICGSETNALKAICPATLDVLLKVLSGYYSTREGVAPSNEIRDQILRRLVLRCVIQIVHVVHQCSPDQRQVEVGAVIEGFFAILLKVCTEYVADSGLTLMIDMLDGIHLMFNCADRLSLQVVIVAEGCFETLMSILQKTMLTGLSAQKLATSILSVISSIMSGSSIAKERFNENIGYTKLVESLKSLGQPSKQILHTVLNLSVEAEFDPNKHYIIHNIQAILMLVQWMPDIQSHDLQTWLSQSLYSVCSWGNQNRMLCCNKGMTGYIIIVLQREKQISQTAINQLILLLQSLGTLSITSNELKQLICLLRVDGDGKQIPHAASLMHAMAVMARKDGRVVAAQYFDFQQHNSGIIIPTIERWPSWGFTFHAWVCMDPSIEDNMNNPPVHRRILYRFLTANGSGFESFFTEQGKLIVVVGLKKEFLTFVVEDANIADQQWHSIDIVHNPSRRPFTPAQLIVYVDGRQRLSAQCKIPTLNEAFTTCMIGCPHLSAPSSPAAETNSTEPTKGLGKAAKFFSYLPLGGSAKNVSANSKPLPQASIARLDESFGTAVSLQGQITSMCLFYEALQHSSIQAMSMAGPNALNLFLSEENNLSDLQSKLLFHYNTKSCQDDQCIDLSPTQMNGHLVGQKFITWDIKDVINSIGGLPVLFPLLEQVGQSDDGDDVDLLSPISPESPKGSPDLLEWQFLPKPSALDTKLEQNQVAGFLTLLRNMIQSCPTNQENLVRTKAIATLGALLQKVDTRLIDVHVLMALQLIVEAIGECHKTLLHHVYQYLLFDFRIWSSGKFPIRIGHIQYILTIIKEDKKYFRKKYGVQYLLDVIRIYYRQQSDILLSEEDSRTIRGSLFRLIKFYVEKDMTSDEAQQLMAFICSVREEHLVIEGLDLVLIIMDCSSKKEHAYNMNILFDTGVCDSLYILLTRKEFSFVVKEKVLKILLLLMKYDRINREIKACLRIQDRGQLQGIINLVAGQTLSLVFIKRFLELLLHAETQSSYSAALNILQLIHTADIEIKIEAIKKLLSTALIANKGTAARLFVKQQGWQELLVRLLIVAPRKANQQASGNSMNPKDNTDVEQSIPLGNLIEVGASNLNDTLVGDLDDTLGMNGTLGDIIDTDTSTWEDQLINILENEDTTTFEDQLSISQTSTTMDNLHDDLTSDDPFDDNTSSISTISNSTIDRPTRKRNISASSSVTSEPYSAESPSALSSMRASQSMPASLMDSCRVSNENEVQMALRRLGVEMMDNYYEQAEELCQNVLVLLYTLMWKGLDGSAKSWKERGQVFAAVHYTQENYVLLKSRIEIKRKLIEMMLQGCIMDLKESGAGHSLQTENACHLIKVIYSFLCLEEEGAPSEKFNERIIEDVMTLLDLMMVWEVVGSRREMEILGLCILLGFAEQENIALCSIATARLHGLLQTRPVDKIQESCYVMGSFDAMIRTALLANTEQYNFLMPVMKALIDKCYDLLEIKTYLPNLPNTNNSPSFFDDFKTYCMSEEWRHFVAKQVLPSMDQYVAIMLDKQQIDIKTYECECHEEMMISGHKRNIERGESKLNLQKGVLESYKTLYRQENKRFFHTRAQLKNQNASAMRHWRSLKAYFVGERGAWRENNQEITHWKHSPTENYYRMKPKLVPNYNFDSHTEASRLRDNPGCESEDTSLTLDLEQLKDAKVTDYEIGDDRLGDEEWNVITEATTATEETSDKEKSVLAEDCELITPSDLCKGRLEVTTTHIYFYDYTSRKEEGAGEDFKVPLCQLREIHFRRYNLRRSALEFFLIDHSNYLINFEKACRNKVYTRILSLRPPRLVYFRTRSPADLLKASGLTQKWVQREISNFEYLMQLNTIAGRTYSDLSQYPVFPWILSDYTSDVLDLENPAVYRDLSKPIGVVNPVKQQDVQEKYECFEDPTGTIEPFHYGTHYSNPATIMHYLVRMEPYTTQHIELQSGKFDVADRQFHSIPNTWKGLMDNPNDVKELIPEFFYLPDFLENSNDFDLGIMQGGTSKLGNVTLPPWATSAEDFIYKHRKALESDYVSAHLHEWIDLIFGYKQKGPAAEEACNVFYYCTYEGAVDLDAITDTMHRKAVEGMIKNFGQTPCQLLKEPHTSRMSFDDAVSRSVKADKSLNILWFLKQLKAYCVEVCTSDDPLTFVCVPKNQARSFIPHGMADSMVGITQSGVLGVHSWLPYDKSISNFFTFEKDPTTTSTKLWSSETWNKSYIQTSNNSWFAARSRKQLAGPFAPGFRVTCRCFAVSHDAKFIYSAGHWDNSLRVYSISKNKNVAHITRHTDIVTCLCLDYSGSHLITGSRDTTSIVWTVQSNASGVLQAVQVLYGHDDEILCVAISVELDMAVSGSKDGTIIIYSVRRGLYLQTLRPHVNLTPPLTPSIGLTVEQITLSSLGHIVVYCQSKSNEAITQQDQYSIHVYTINGKLLTSELIYCSLGHMTVVEGHVILGNDRGVIIIKELHCLKTLSTVPLQKAITCLSVTGGNSHILAGLTDGKLIVVGISRQQDIK